jgi:hypothetical protein
MQAEAVLVADEAERDALGLVHGMLGDAAGPEAHGAHDPATIRGAAHSFRKK